MPTKEKFRTDKEVTLCLLAVSFTILSTFAFNKHRHQTMDFEHAKKLP